MLISTSSIAKRRHKSSQIRSNGTPRTGTIHFGVFSVKGRRRVPFPAANKKAFTHFSLNDSGSVCGSGRRIARENPESATAFVAVNKGVVDDSLSTCHIE